MTDLRADLLDDALPLDQAPGAYETFRKKEDGCIKVVLQPCGHCVRRPLRWVGDEA